MGEMKQLLEKIVIFDTTLRDGEQSPGASMNTHEKVLVAKQLESLGVDKIEAGFPASSPGDFDAVRAVSQSVSTPIVVGLCRTRPEDIARAWDAVKEAKNPGLHTFIATSDIHMKYKLKMTREQVLKTVEEAVGNCSKLCKSVEFSAEDATRSDRDFLVDVFNTALKAGADTINIPDTVGYTTPQEFYDLVQYIKDRLHPTEDITISVHCHNDLGLATANSLSAILAGARQVECTINGIGERAGNTSLEEVVMTILEFSGFRVGATERDSILNPLPEKSPATLDKTPASLSTRTEITCLISSPHTSNIFETGAPAGTMGYTSSSGST